MKYNRFEDLPVWRDAIKLALGVYELTRHRAFEQTGDLRDQLRRASLSVSNNIAEGFERGSTAELLAFLYIARGSAGEVRSMLHFVGQLTEAKAAFNRSRPNAASNDSNMKSEISNLKSQISDLTALAESCSKQIRGWADKLQNSDIRGQKFLNDEVRHKLDARERRAAFQRRLEETLHQARPALYPAPAADS